MSEMNTQNAGSQGVTVKMSKLTEGIGVLFSGVLTMLEALDAGTAKALTEGFAHPDAVAGSDKTEDTAPVNSAAEVAEAGEAEKADEPATTQPAQERKPEPGSVLTADDVARIVVQKVKANPGINEKIRALVIAHGAQRVTELKPEVLEAFLTDLSQL